MGLGIKDVGSAMKLMSKLDMRKINELSEKVDLDELIGMVTSLDESTLNALMKMAKSKKKDKKLPEVNGDFYDFSSGLSARQQDLQLKVRGFMESEVEPIINEYWARDEFPKQLIGKFRDLDLINQLFDENGERLEDASVIEGIATMEMARIDVSTATFFGVHSGLAMDSILVGGSEEQKAQWLPKMRNMDIIGAFGLTEPKVGSGRSGWPHHHLSA